MGAYSRWALIRGWALIRIKTVFVLSDIRTTQDYLSLQKFSVSLFCKPCT